MQFVDVFLLLDVVIVTVDFFHLAVCVHAVVPIIRLNVVVKVFH